MPFVLAIEEFYAQWGVHIRVAFASKSTSAYNFHLETIIDLHLRHSLVATLQHREKILYSVY
jgi:hypothetical protein